MEKILSSVKNYDPRQFAAWRILFGLYIAYYMLRTLPYAAEIYSSAGMIRDAHLNWTYGYFPSIFFWFDSPLFVQIGIAVSALLGVCIMLGFWRRVAALVLWYLWASFVSRNVLTIEPSLYFVGWLIAALVVIPEGEPWTIRKSKADWFMPASIYWGAWLILGVMFTVSGIDKFASPSWQNGLAVKYMIEQPFAAQGWLPPLLGLLPIVILKTLSWLAAGTMLVTLPLMVSRYTRPIIWSLVVGMFVFADLAFGIPAQIILGMMLYYAFIFDSDWLPDISRAWRLLAQRFP